MTELTCACEKSFEADVPETVDLAAAPWALEEILAGRFLTFACPHCGKEIKPELPFNVVDDSGLDIQMIPELERDRYLLGRYSSGQHDRVVIGYRELVEKLRVYQAGLDDRVVEVIKYYLLVKAGSGTAPSIFFRSLDEDALVFEIAGLREEEIAMARIPRKVYESTLGEIDRKSEEEPFSIILEPPYVSIEKIELEVEED